MTSELQSLVAIAVVAAAALYVVKRAWSSWRAARLADGRNSGGGCDCHSR